MCWLVWSPDTHSPAFCIEGLDGALRSAQMASRCFAVVESTSYHHPLSLSSPPLPFFLSPLIPLLLPSPPAAYKQADGRKVDNRRVLVDVERGRTVPNWRPRRLGGGLGNTRVGGEDVNIRQSGRDVVMVAPRAVEDRPKERPAER